MAHTLGTPWMTASQVRQIEMVLLRLAASRQHLNCLEWGSGGSTVHFPRFMAERRIAFTWTSLEYDAGWHEKVIRATAPDSNIIVRLFEIKGEKPVHIAKRRDVLMNDYVDYPLHTGGKFDFVLVDGRKRRRCLYVASATLKEGGVAVLHDASRSYYQCAFSAFRKSAFLEPDLWAGEM